MSPIRYDRSRSFDFTSLRSGRQNIFTDFILPHFVQLEESTETVYPVACMADGSFVMSWIASFSWDIWFFVVLTMASIVYGLVAGRDRAIVILVSTYIALAAVTNAPLLSLLSQRLGVDHIPSLRLFWFLGLFLAIFIVLWRSELLRNLGQSRGGWWEAALFSVLQMGLAVAATLFLLPSEAVQKLSPFVRLLFLSDIARSVWLLAPIICLAIVGRRFADDRVFDDDDE